jgi:AcrR family transcriptional regulator
VTPSKATGTRQRKPPEQRRREILEAVRATAVKSGIESVTARDVAQRAGIAPGLIHYYFGSVEELLAEAFESWAGEAMDVLHRAAGQPPATKITMLGQNLGRDHRFWHDALGAATRHTALRERAGRVTADYIAWVKGAIEEGVNDGSFSCADPNAAAWRIVLLLDGLIAMVFVLRILKLDDALGLLGGAVERELALEAGTFAAAQRRQLTNLSKAASH